MKKKFGLIAVVAVCIVLLFGLSSGAWWTVQNQATGNEFKAATFDMTIQGTGQHTVDGACVFVDMVPGGDPVECKIWLHNASSIPINVLWSGFALTGDSAMQDWIFVTKFEDSNATTNLSDLSGFFGADGKLSLKEAAVPLGNGWFSNPNNVNNSTSTFLAPGADGWVSLTFAFGAEAPNTTIGKTAGFTWTLEGRQLPKNSTP